MKDKLEEILKLLAEADDLGLGSDQLDEAMNKLEAIIEELE